MDATDASLPAPLITTIIPTMASKARAASLKRAITSIRVASKQPVAIIVVVNGTRSDPEACAWLADQPDVRLEFDAKPSAANAMLRGRELVATPFFTSLDDDDEFTPGALDLRLAAMQSDTCPDIVVCNGLRRDSTGDTLCYDDLPSVPAAPLPALFRMPWLSSCNSLYRTASIDAHFFRNFHSFAEWTWLAYQFGVAGKKIAVIDTPTFVCNDTAGSLSKSNEYEMAYLSLYERMLSLAPPAPVADLIRRRIGSFWHDQSVTALRGGQRLDALRHHVRSLRQPGGLRYLGYSRYLIPGWPQNR